MIINLKPDIFSKFRDFKILLDKDEIGIFLFVNGKNYILGKFSKEYNLKSILNELFELYREIEIFDEYSIDEKTLELIKKLEVGVYIKNDKIYKLKPSSNDLRFDLHYRVQVLCGNDTAHIYVDNAIEMDYKELMDSLKNCQTSINPLIFTAKCNETSIILFKDGKALIREKDINEERARVIYEKLVFRGFLMEKLMVHQNSNNYLSN